MPVTAGLVESGVGALAQGVGALFTAKKRKRAEREYEAEIAKQKPDEGIMDVYNKALSRYNPNAYQSAFYNQQKQNVLGQQAAGIGALQDRRSALAGIPSITQASNRALQSAGVAAEQQQAQQLGQLSGAASAVAAEKNRIKNLKLGVMGRKAANLAETQNQLTQGAINLGVKGLSYLDYGGKNKKTNTKVGANTTAGEGYTDDSSYNV
jgi:hypothetical protein